ncbi:MAG TPA: aminotransferase class V-fold PLP-dependent enzyme, partial [Gemmatales bacterium]|nr:aminotransferase class V-fold PLP-dependent enzyme [Gemmatales bacterium]
HKWFMSPNGAGFLFVKPGREQLIEPWQVSWGYKYDSGKAHVPGEYGCTYWQRSFEFEGTRDITPWLTLDKGVDFLETLGSETIRNRQLELASFVRKKVVDHLRWEVVSPALDALRGGLTAFRLPAGLDGNRLRQHLWEQYRVEINLIPHSDGPYFRVSTHIYNLEEEIERLISLIPEAVSHAI